MNLRPYQKLAVESIMQKWVDHDSCLLVMATGLGKTICFSEICRKSPGKVMVLAHREELIWQAKDKIERTTGLKCVVEMAQLRAESKSVDLFGSAKVIISTVQTQISGGENPRMKKFNPSDFDVLIVDESHHGAANSYRKVISHYMSNPNLRLLGVTATPDRADEIALGEIFETVAFDYGILEGINDGWLVPIEQQMVQVLGLDFSSVRTTAGDLNGADLISIMEAEKVMQGVVGASLDIIGDKKAIVFTAGVKQAEVISEIFNRHQPGMSAWLCGETPKEERREILSRFSYGRIKAVVNCGILTEGFDDPTVEVIIMARPTKSRSLYAQMVGRATRALPGIVDNYETPEERKLAIQASAKPACLIVDFVGNSGRHKLISTVDILGGKASEEVMALALRKASVSGKKINIRQLIDESEEEIRLARLKEQEERRMLEEARRARIIASVEYSKKSVDPFERYRVKWEPPNEWDRRAGRVFSEKQSGILRKMGVDPDKVSFTAGKKLIGGYFSEPSEAQKKVLAKHGYPTDCSREEASRLITELANNGWRRPEVVP